MQIAAEKAEQTQRLIITGIFRIHRIKPGLKEFILNILDIPVAKALIFDPRRSAVSVFSAFGRF
jgi:hypothetical protein